MLLAACVQVFLPSSREHADDDFSVEQLAPVRLMKILFTLIMGWPMYLFLNSSGRPYPRWANHFDPYSPIFTKRERTEVGLGPCKGLLPCCRVVHLQVWDRSCQSLHGVASADAGVSDLAWLPGMLHDRVCSCGACAGNADDEVAGVLRLG